MAGLLAGCAAPPTYEEMSKAEYGPPVKDYQATIRSHMETTLKDPDSAKYDFYRAPVKAYSGRPPLYGWGTCFKVNAKNSYGGYTGMQQYFVLISYDRVVKTLAGDGTNGIMDGIVAQSCANLGPAP